MLPTSNPPLAPTKRGDVTYTAPCPAGGHDATWHGAWVRLGGHDAVTLEVDCAVCP